MTPLLLAFVCVSATVEVPVAGEPLTFLPLDITAAMNADPWDPPAMAIPGLPYLDALFVHIEGEAVFRAEGAGERAVETASQGAALHGLGDDGDWAEWAFDAPFDTDDAILYARVARGVGEGEAAAGIENPFTILATHLNDRPGGVLYAVAGDHPDDFSTGIVKADLGLLRMGRHVIRLSTRMPGEPVTVDCIWIAARGLDIRNELDDAGSILRPFAVGVLAYEPGRILVNGVIPFDLVDPRRNEGRGVVLVPGDDGAELPMNGQIGDALLLLGAGGLTNGHGVVTLHYADGSEEAHSVRWPPLYARSAAPAEEVTVPLGHYRRATIRRIPLTQKPLAAVHLRREGESRLLVIAATLSHGSDP